MHVEPIAELKENKPFQVMFTYRLMLDLLWTTYTTPPCPHDIRKRTALPQPPLKLGPDAAVLLNCWDWLTNDHRIEDSDDESAGPRIWICLTFGSPGIRWVAIDAAENNGMIHDEFRDIMLRSDSCCADCALEHVALHEGRWILIL
ncbi:hypothetical protein BDW74DRAFT_155783 [Aspergillus multicolor]|uniref:uncharacterized protein n=1 Tax=Aspergillus multicolor TaxID=41759 RepID=UPI003CCD5CAA